MPLECPANYFGKGEDYLLPDDPKVLGEFERKFKEWEDSHPEDPTGDIALAHDKIASSSSVENRSNGAISTEEKKNPLPLTITEPSPELESDGLLKEIELVMPENYIKLFKEYCKEKRRRPRDMMMTWIKEKTAHLKK